MQQATEIKFEPHTLFFIFLQLSDYLHRDWTGVLEISPDIEEFKAIPMETDFDEELVNKYLSLSIHADHVGSLDLHIYAPYWIVNKTQLPLQLRVIFISFYYLLSPFSFQDLKKNYVSIFLKKTVTKVK